MRFSSALLCAVVALSPAWCGADDSIHPRTGDAAFDQWLVSFNDQLLAMPAAKAIGEISEASGAVPEVIEKLLGKGYNPADVYLIARTAKVAGLPSKRVLAQYESDRNDGWGAIFQNLEIRTDSGEFARLKLRADQAGGAGPKLVQERSGVDMEVSRRALDAKGLPVSQKAKEEDKH